MRFIPSLRSGLLAAALLLAGAAQAQAVRVGSKIDTEGSLLGQLVVQVLEAGGVKTENRLQLGNTKIVRSALLAGEIDLYPEYTGNGAFFHADEKNPAWKGGVTLKRPKGNYKGVRYVRAPIWALPGRFSICLWTNRSPKTARSLP